jgi:DNA topoisomerase-3
VDFIPTTEAIRGFQNLKPSANYDNLYYAGFSRAIGDWLLYECTRLYTVKHGGYKQVLSIEGANPNIGNGRDRFKEIKNFKPQPY